MNSALGGNCLPAMGALRASFLEDHGMLKRARDYGFSRLSSRLRGRAWGGVGALVVLGSVVTFWPDSVFAGSSGAAPLWRERFDRSPLSWADPAQHSPSELARIYSLGQDGPIHFLHAHHDASGSDAPKALHYGQGFRQTPVPLDSVKSLKWRWRVLRHPSVGGDPWVDVAASVYVVMRVPSVLPGRGFKFGWLAYPGPSDTKQRGLRQIPLRSDVAGREWKDESVDLCALYRQYFGDCAGQEVLYVGVVTDADGTHSVAEADYANFELIGASH